MNIYRAIVSILKADNREYTSRELLEQLEARYRWATRSKTPDKTLDARLGHVVESSRYPVLKKKIERGTVFYYAPDKLAALERSLSRRSPLEVPPITITVRSKVAETGRLDVEHFARVLLACSRSIEALGKSRRGPGGKQPSNYELEVIAPPRTGSLELLVAPVAPEGIEACREWFAASQQPRFLNEQSKKALRTIAPLSELVGRGRPLESVKLTWPIERESPLQVTLDQEWYDAVPEDESQADDFTWVERVTHESFIVSGGIDELDKGYGSFRLKTRDASIKLSYDPDFFSEVDRDRWRRVAVLCAPPDSVLDIVRVNDESEVAATSGNIHEADTLALRKRLEALDRSALLNELIRRLTIMQWAAVRAGKILALPFLTAEEAAGIGLWWRNPLSKRELDLDLVSGTWNYLKTVSADLLVGPISDATLAEAVTEGEVNDDSELVDLTRWFIGVEAEEG